MINVKEYTDLDFERLVDFCKEQSKEDHPAAPNMWAEDWETKPETLLNKLKNSNLFSNGKGAFFLLEEDGNIIGCSGIYISDFSERVAIAGVRTWVEKKYRVLQYVKNYLLPIQKDWAVEKGIDVIALTFNDYNSGIRRLFTIGQATGTRTSRHIFSKNFNMLDYMVTVQYVPQWVIYENLTDYRFDWSTLKVE